jgi:hypothetical protein
MIPNGTIERLERITNYLDRKKDAQDGDYGFYESTPPFAWLLPPLLFPPPRLLNGCMTEEALYHWLGKIEHILARNEEFEEERLIRLCVCRDRLQQVLERPGKPGAADKQAAPASVNHPLKGYFCLEAPDELPIVYADDSEPSVSPDFAR